MRQEKALGVVTAFPFISKWGFHAHTLVSKPDMYVSYTYILVPKSEGHLPASVINLQPKHSKGK